LTCEKWSRAFRKRLLGFEFAANLKWINADSPLTPARGCFYKYPSNQSKRTAKLPVSNSERRSATIIELVESMQPLGKSVGSKAAVGTSSARYLIGGTMNACM
jgi:hypothetical protein